MENDALPPPTLADLRLEAPFVLHDRGMQSLHFTIGEIQSRMSTDRPDELQIDYTCTMMGFLLLHPAPRRICMIGLGGGSLPKFCYRHLPQAQITVVEINPGVIALRRQFGVPDDDGRFAVLADDGALYVRRAPGAADVLLVDGFDHAGQPAQLCSRAFYDDCFAALAAGGVAVFNLHADHPLHLQHVDSIAQAFRGNAVQVLAREKGNCIVLAGRRRPVTVEALRSAAWRQGLDAAAQFQLKAEFDRMGWVATPLPAE